MSRLKLQAWLTAAAGAWVAEAAGIDGVAGVAGVGVVAVTAGQPLTVSTWSEETSRRRSWERRSD